jgi:hypothetical protein
MSSGKYDWVGCRKRRQKNYLRNKNGCDKQAAFFQPNHDPGGVIICIRRQKHAEDGKQQQEDDPELKILLHKAHDSTLIWPLRKKRNKALRGEKAPICKAEHPAMAISIS